MSDNNGVRPLALSPREAAQTLSVSEKTLWSLTQPRGPIPAARFRRMVRYDVRDLLAFLDAQKDTPAWKRPEKNQQDT